MGFESQNLSPAAFEPLRAAILDWWYQQSFEFSWRTEELEEWKKLVTEILLQRTRVGAVEEVFGTFFRKYDELSDFAAADAEEIRQDIYSLGLLWRADYLDELGQRLVDLGGVPGSRTELEALPGVGPYVSGAFLTLHRNQPQYFVDANVVRVLSRYFGFEYDGETRRKKWLIDLVKALFDHEREPREFGYALLDFSREICGRVPRCEVCEARSTCRLGIESTSK